MGPAPSVGQSDCEDFPVTANCKVIADFESEALDAPPPGWQTNKGRRAVPLTREGIMTPTHNVYVREEEGRRFARIHTENYGFRVIRSREEGLTWHLGKRPYLRWTWRAKALPEGADESRSGRNDTGGALYVTFDTDWLGRPRSIKYTYSSALPVGTTVDFGTLKVLVVASKQEQGIGEWVTHERNVIEDYKRLFGGTPDKTPLGVAMWSDSDSVDSVGTIDFDYILALSRSLPIGAATVSSQ